MLNAEETKREKAKRLRYRKSMVRNLNLESIQEDLWEISSACDDVRYYWECDDDTLLNALDGNEDEAYEFKMMFADLCAECEQMQEDLSNEYIPSCFDDIFVANGGGNVGGGLLGWDSYEQDYYGLDLWNREAAEDESKKRLMRMTKEQIIECTRACFGVLYAYLGIRQRYDNLKAAMDILKDQNTGYLQMVDKIAELYDKAEEDNFREWHEATRELNRFLEMLPQEAWIQ